MYGKKSISQSLLDAVNSVTHADVQEGWDEMMKDVKARSGPQPNGGAGIKLGTRYGGGKQKDDEREKETERLEKKKMKKEDMYFKDRLIESLKGNQHKIDKNKNNKIDAQDFKILRAQQKEEVVAEGGLEYDPLHPKNLANTGLGMSLKTKIKRRLGHDEYGDIRARQGGPRSLHYGKKPNLPEEVEQTDEAMSHQAATTMKHIPNPSPALKKAAKDIKPGIAGYRDRIDMLKAGGVKEESGEVKKSKGLTVDTLAGPKKAPKGFEKDNEHTSAKVPLKTEEVEQIDELSVDTLNRVHRAAVKDANDFSRDGDEVRADKRYNLAGKASYKAELKNRAAGLKPSGQHSMKEGKRPDLDTVPFITNQSQTPKERLRAALGKVKSEAKKSW